MSVVIAFIGASSVRRRLSAQDGRLNQRLFSARTEQENPNGRYQLRHRFRSLLRSKTPHTHSLGHRIPEQNSCRHSRPAHIGTHSQNRNPQKHNATQWNLQLFILQPIRLPFEVGKSRAVLGWMIGKTFRNLSSLPGLKFCSTNPLRMFYLLLSA